MDLALLGGGSNYAYAIKLGVAIIICLSIRHLTVWWKRIFLYLIIVIPFLVANYESKREIIFVLLIFFLMELSKRKPNLNLSFKNIIFGLALGLIFSGLILTASILRGYGGYKIENPLSAIKYLPDYINSDFIYKGLAINFELSTTYGNSSNAIDYIYKKEVDYLYGSTFFKVFFLPIPRRVFPNKPESMVNIYTKKFAPEYYKIGSTRPIVIYSEFYGILAL